MPINIRSNPNNIELMDVPKFLESIQAMPVTSHAIKDNSGQLHPDGLFSEIIFGQVGTPQRITRIGYINLSPLLPVLHPEVYFILTSMKKLYESILSGKQYAVWNKESHDFELITKSTQDESSTGYNFFIEHLKELEIPVTPSDKRKINIEIIKRYKNRLLIDKVPVLAAAIRDIKDEDDRLTAEPINKLYLGLLSLSQALPEKILEIKLYDQLRYNIQLKINAIYERLMDLLEGKGGFVQRRFGARAIALSARNVISSAPLSALSPKDPKYLHSDETAIPLVEGLKTSQPLVINNIKSKFIDYIFMPNSSQITVIDPTNYNLVYITVNDLIKDQFVQYTKIEDMINTFINNPDTRFKPITIRSADPTDKKEYYLFMIYEDDNNTLYLERSLDVLKDHLKDRFDIKRLRPWTYIEMCYTATYFVTKNNHTLITRYPVINFGGIYPSKIKTTTTSPDRTVYFKSTIITDDKQPTIMFPHYPVLGGAVIDCIQVHPSRLPIIGGDHDGDTVSDNTVWTKEANDEITNYLDSISSVLSPNGDITAGGLNTSLIKLAIYNITA
jgi:hypothetical protein